MQTIEKKSTTLKESVHQLISKYISSSEKPSELGSLYDFMIEQVEPPLLEASMEKCKWNQVRAAKLLGISRGNLRKKLVRHFDDKYCAKRGEE